MKRTLAIFAVVACLMSLAGSALAQIKTPVIRERQENQKERIKEGVKSGEVTKGEAAKLRAEQAKIQAEKRVAKADGKVTGSERARIQRHQNKASRHIYKEKHDKQTGK